RCASGPARKSEGARIAMRRGEGVEAPRTVNASAAISRSPTMATTLDRTSPDDPPSDDGRHRTPGELAALERGVSRKGEEVRGGHLRAVLRIEERHVRRRTDVEPPSRQPEGSSRTGGEDLGKSSDSQLPRRHQAVVDERRGRFQTDDPEGRGVEI